MQQNQPYQVQQQPKPQQVQIHQPEPAYQELLVQPAPPPQEQLHYKNSGRRVTKPDRYLP